MKIPTEEKKKMEEDFLNKTKTNAEKSKIPMLNVMVAGKSGVGKTTLVNTVFSKQLGSASAGAPATMGVIKYSVPGFPISIYDVQGFEVGATSDAVVDLIQGKISEMQQKADPDCLIDAVLYCIDHSGARFEPYEAEFIRRLDQEFQIPIFIVFTKAYFFDLNHPEKDELTNFVKGNRLNVKGYFHVLCEKVAFPKNPPIESFGVDELIDKLFETLPENKVLALSFARKIKLKQKKKAASNWVWVYAAGNFVLGASIPPGFDIAYLASVETIMAAQITDIMYEGSDKNIKDNMVKALEMCAGPLVSSVAGTLAFEETIKLLGYVGILVTGGASEAVAALAGGMIAAGITVALGHTCIWIVEQMLEGKISAEQLKQKDPAAMKEMKQQMKSFYSSARKQMKEDKRFSKENFGKAAK